MIPQRGNAQECSGSFLGITSCWLIPGYYLLLTGKSPISQRLIPQRPSVHIGASERPIEAPDQGRAFERRGGGISSPLHGSPVVETVCNAWTRAFGTGIQGLRDRHPGPSGPASRA